MILPGLLNFISLSKQINTKCAGKMSRDESHDWLVDPASGHNATALGGCDKERKYHELLDAERCRLWLWVWKSEADGARSL